MIQFKIFLIFIIIWLMDYIEIIFLFQTRDPLVTFISIYILIAL